MRSNMSNELDRTIEGRIPRPQGDLSESAPLRQVGKTDKHADFDFESLFELSPDAIVVVNQHGCIVLVNAQTENLFGYGRMELVDKPIETLMPERFRRQHPTQRNEFLAHPTVRGTGSGLDLFGLRKDGREFPAEIMLRRLEMAAENLIAATIRDISARRAGAAHLVQMESRYRGLLEAAPDAMVVVNQAGEIVLLNLQAEKRFGYYRDELIGQQVKNIIPVGFAERLITDGTRTAAEALAQQIGTGIELAGRRKDGSEFPIEMMLSPLESAEGILVTAAIRDITVRKLAEAHLAEMVVELRRSEETDERRRLELKVKDEVLSHVSHELRSPLTSIYSFGSIIADGLAGETTKEQEEYLQIILRNVRQLQSMIEDLLEVTQVRAGKLSIELQPASLPEAIDYTIETFRGVARSKEIVVTSNVSERLPSVYADPTRLRQILTILFDNAIKFTPIGGSVDVRANVFEKQPGFLLVEVSDTGCGVRPELTERIFEHLYQVADEGKAGRKGLGLGLHIAKELVLRHGGEIWMNSEPLKGSRFFFTMPVFSLTKLIGPMLKHEKRTGEAIAVLTVEIHSRDGSPGVPKEILREAQMILQQCLRLDTDVLIPNTTSPGERELLFIVGYMQENGGEAFCQRIQAQLNNSELLRPADLTFAISYSLLAPMSRETNELGETFAERVSAAIQDRIEAVCSGGAA
jgi:PAS domain S-box-containing protein